MTTYYVRDMSGNVLSTYDEEQDQALVQKEVPIYGASRLGHYKAENDEKMYELTDHLGTVRALISRDKNTDGTAEILMRADYYPFGMEMPGRKYSSEAYRYGYQGQYAEKDGETGLHSFELRQWDARIARWNSTDPYGQYFSPYMGMGNNPVSLVDPDGGLDDWYMNLETGNVEWLFTSGQVDGYAWIGDASMSFGDAVSIAGDWASSTNFLSEIVLSEPSFVEPKNQFETGGGMVNSFSVSFAFMGGYTIEVGKVSDDDGNSKRFLSHGPTIGFGLGASYNLHEIRSSHSRKFTLDMYEGDASGYDVGYSLLGGYYGGDLPLDINSSDGFRKFGENYYELGLSGVASKGPKFGAWWSKTNTITFD